MQKLMDALSSIAANLTTGPNYLKLTEVQQQQALAALSSVVGLKALTTEPTKFVALFDGTNNSIYDPLSDGNPETLDDPRYTLIGRMGITFKGQENIKYLGGVGATAEPIIDANGDELFNYSTAVAELMAKTYFEKNRC